MTSETVFKKGDLYVYDLSATVLQSLRLITYDSTLREVDPVTEPETEDPSINDKLSNNSVSDSSKCYVCGLEFQKLQQNRDHRKTDFHIFNVKRSIRGLSSIDEGSFESILREQRNISNDTESEGDNDSDGSDSEELYDEKNTQLDDVLENEMSKLSVGVDHDTTVSHLNTRSAQIYFNSNLLLDSEAFGVYKALFSNDQLSIPFQSLRQWNDPTDLSIPISALFMVAGGHFAGAIVSHQRTNVDGNARKVGQSLQEQAVIFLEHKTFHRYTTRRKQGGSQSAMDQAKGKANSAGSSLRRYNEAALRTDIAALLEEWEPYLSKCHNIFVRAHNNVERKLFTENKAIKANKESVKSFPFTTGRPTISELKRSWCELTYLKKVTKPSPLPLKKPTAVNGSLDTSKTATASKDEESKKEKSLEEQHTEQMLLYLKKGKAPLLLAYMRKHKVGVDFLLAPLSKYSVTPTMLHLASQQGLRQMVTILLCNMKCNPCLLNSAGKTAWDLAKDVKVERAFQLARYKLGEDYTDWLKSHIAEPLSREQIEELEREERERENKEARAAIEQELKAVKEKKRAEVEARRGQGRTLENASMSLSPNLNSLSEDQRRRLLREQRARAAEARMRKQ
ncbi:hypothetical protein HG536_0C03610 [Torulaspora globosa]|uniref:VLRF1 domain-containing protein n=1 Tax=Torulaspora globosa TaxID=48254 RepID=A0A7G3ZFA7_9SACH|nr:uncharacterized protein HG536_0C03610 [Torulaspora globosa]QLL32193.1 hypothetical protein HG536_0C03610 [Torulaspora globosa]